MDQHGKFFLLLMFICLIVQGFFAMIEMACVSFNKVRLQYYVSKGKRRAMWLSYLLNHPALLFGTSLIGVNTALQVGSECSRRFYESLGLSPDLAPLSQVVIVLIFAEIAPLFAGRRYAEHVAMLGVPLLYAASIVLRPIIWCFDLLCRTINFFVGGHGEKGLYLSREELQNILEEKEEASITSKEEFNTIVSKIFTLRGKTAKDLMQPLKNVPLVPSICTISEMRQLLSTAYTPFLPIYHKTPENIIAIAYPRDLLRLEETKRVRDFARPPWFIVETSPILQILKQFRRNNQSIAIVLNDAGLAQGVLTLDEIIDEIFERSDNWMAFEEISPRMYHVVLDRTFPGSTLLSEINVQYQVRLGFQGATTLEELLTLSLGHPPVKGESVRIDQFVLTVEEAPLIGEKMIAVHTVY